jgi:ribosomal protein S18 acetylase RimI-like enzyme
MDFRFTTEYPLSRLDEIVSYLLGPRLWIPRTDYPDFEDWVQKAYQEIRGETKRAVIALSQNQIVGAVIYQRHKQFPETLELKNLTVRPDQRGRYIASFLVRNAEVEGTKEFGATSVLCDAKANNFGIRMFLMQHRYRIISETDLYHLNAGGDIIYRKDLHPLLV